MTGFAGYAGLDATGLAELVRRGEISASVLLAEAISRTERYNPQLNAVITPMYEIARATAAGPLPHSPLAGVPFLLKDLLQAYAGVPMTSGSESLRDYRPDADSAVVSRFKAAGLVSFGKTNVPEFGLVATTEPRAFGPTRNPWDLARSAGGSSGGSAAAVAARLVPMASANDGGGSIRIPAAWCGLFGLKPSRGRVSAGPYYGDVWGGAVAEHVLTRSVRDSAAVLDATWGPSTGDPYLVAPPERPYSEEVVRPPGRLRIAFTTRSPLGAEVDPECREAVLAAARLLEELGHELVESAFPVDGVAVARAYLTLYFGYVAAEVRWVERVAGKERAKRIEEPTRVLALLGETLSAADFIESHGQWNGFGRAMGAFHQEYDLLLTPTTAALPIQIGSLQQSPLEQIALKVVNRLSAGRLVRASGIVERLAFENLAPVPFTQLANLTGQPAMSVPLHWSAAGLPCGAHFMAAMGGESVLYRLAGQLEEARPWADRMPPLLS